MRIRRWLGFIGALFCGVLATVLQVCFSLPLALELPKFYPPLLPDVRLRALFCAVAFVIAMIASYRPLPVQKACSLWYCFRRGLLWAALVAGYFYQLNTMVSRFTLLNPRPYADPVGSVVVFILVWVLTFGAFASDALQRRRELSTAEV